MPHNAAPVEYSSLPPELQLEIFKQTPAFDMVALAHATGKTYEEILGNHLLDATQKQDFILANAPFMDEEEILDCIETLAPNERAPVLLPLLPFMRSNEGRLTIAKHTLELKVPVPEGMTVEYLISHHGPKKKPVLGALRNLGDSPSRIKTMPFVLRKSAKWVMDLRQLETGMRTLSELDHDAQFKLLKEVEKWIVDTPPEFEDYTKGFVKDLIEAWKSLPLESKILALRMIEKISNKADLSAHERIEISEMLAILLDDAVKAPHSPSLQKEVVCLVEDFYYKEVTSEKGRVALLKKLGSIGGKLHAAPIYDVRPDQNVQGHAYQFFKQELGHLSSEGRANVASHWAKQNAQWDTGYRPFTRKHWQNIGYAAGAVAVAGATTGGIISAATLPAVTASTTNVVSALRTTIAKSMAISGTIGTVAGGVGGLAGVDDFGPMAFTSTASWIAGGYLTPFRQLYNSGLSFAAAGATGSVAAGWATGFAAGNASYEILRRARRAIKDEGGVKQVATRLRNNPVSSVQTAVQRTAAEVFSFNRLPQDPTRRAEAVQELGPHWLTWVEAMSSFPPARQATLRADLAKVFNPANYNPEDWQAVEQSIALARTALEKKVV